MSEVCSKLEYQVYQSSSSYSRRTRRPIEWREVGRGLRDPPFYRRRKFLEGRSVVWKILLVEEAPGTHSGRETGFSTLNNKVLLRGVSHKTTDVWFVVRGRPTGG